jgi:hypothetical protein
MQQITNNRPSRGTAAGRRIFEISISLILIALLPRPLRAQDTPAAIPNDIKGVPATRIEEVAAMLDDKPAGFGSDYHNRAVWTELARKSIFAKVIPRAEALLTKPFPAWDEAAFLDYSRTGKRAVTTKLFNDREAWLAPLVWAECLENRGRFVPLINKVLEEYVHQETWTRPFNNPPNGNEKTVHYSVGLESAAFGRELAQALYMLDDKVAPNVRADVMQALHDRIFTPVLTSYRTGRGHWWITAKMNWNSVCLSGVTGAALTVLPSREERAVFAAAGAYYSANGVAGYKEDGYDPEGPGYYNFGFGNYITLREALFEATHGKIDLFSDPKIRNIALFGPRITILNGWLPPFEDCHFGTTIDPYILWYCSRTLRLGLTEYDSRSFAGPDKLVQGSFLSFPNSATETPPAPAATASEEGVGIRSYFDKAQVLVCRPFPGGQFGVALKGGNNDKPHNHNDVGSFVIVVGKEELGGSPGGPFVYNSRTFGPGRYTEFKTFASYSQPVPLVAGVQQKVGAQAAAANVTQDFTDARDIFSMEIQSAYPVPGLQKLLRTFVFSREGSGSLSVRDEFAMEQPGAFETALVSHAKWTRPTPDTIAFTNNGETLLAKVAASADWDLTSDTVTEDAPTFYRLAVRLKQPATQGWVNITYSPGSTSPPP